MSRSVWRIEKEEAVGERAMVAAEHPLAAEAGLEVLRRGGNAVDAAVTMAFAMGVLRPAGSGIGGGGLMVIHRAATRQNLVLDFAMDAPLAATADAYTLEDQPGPSRFGWRKVRDDANMLGYRAAAVPGQVRGLAAALERFGTIPLAAALEPAIHLAEAGFEVDGQLALEIAEHMPLLSRFPPSAALFLPGGVPPRAASGHADADRLVQSDLARTLRLIARDGPRAFYNGPIARAITRAMREHGGLIAEEDLARYQPTLYEGGLEIAYRGCQVVGVPGACGGLTALQGLAILESFDLAALPPDSADALHLQAEAYRRAFADRYRHLGDPKQVRVPWRGLLHPAYARELARAIDPARAAPSVTPGDPWRFEPASEPPAVSSQGSVPPPGGWSTTHICAVDVERNVVSLTQTIVDGFGCGVVVPDTGILLNNAMLWLDPEPGRPNSIAPGKRGLNNMSPLLVLRDGRPLLAVGAPGGARIINAMSQVCVNVLDHGMGIQAAIAAPRLDCSGPELLVDSRLDGVTPALAARGHRLRVVEESLHAAHFSTPLGILIDPRTGRLHGGVHPFRVSVAAGD